MDKKQAINIISKCAKTYKKQLDGCQVVFVHRDGSNHSDYTEVQFRSYNFLHFTGVTPRSGLNANNFYRFALNSRLSVNDFSFKNDHTTELKLQILSTIMNIDTRARMIGDYAGAHLDLYTEKVTGTTTACLGLIQKDDCFMIDVIRLVTQQVKKLRVHDTHKEIESRIRIGNDNEQRRLPLSQRIQFQFIICRQFPELPDIKRRKPCSAAH